MADKTVKDLDELHLQGKGARGFFDKGWALDLAMFEGKQWLALDGSSGALINPLADTDDDRVTETINLITGIVRTELAKMTKNSPVFVVTPNSGSQEDANASELGERVMRFLWEHLGMHELDLKCLEWSRVCGAGFLKCFWDPTLGDPFDVLVGPDGKSLPDPETGRPLRGRQPQAEAMSQVIGAPVSSKRISQGDARVEVRSPFQMVCDPIAETFPEVEWVIEESIRSLNYAKQRFPDAKNLKADTPANPGLVQGRILGGQNKGAYMGVRIREYWCKPCDDWPNGVKRTWIPGKDDTLQTDENPHDPMPYVMLTGIPVPGRLWGMGIVELLRGPQVGYNKVRSQMTENRNRVGNPTLAVSKQAVQDWEQMLDSTVKPGGVLAYDETGSTNALPVFLQAPPLPEYVVQEPQMRTQEIEAISGQHEVTNAQVPAGVTAASAITLLQEADDTRLALGIRDHEVQLGRLGSKLLKLVQRYYTDSRILKIAGDDGAWQIFDFRGSDLKGNTGVSVQAGSMYPQSLAMKQAMINDTMTFLMESGNAPHGRQLAQFLRDAGMGAMDKLVEEYTRSETQANRENVLMSQPGAQMLPINPQDDDQAHLDNHEDYERTPHFFTLPPQNQQIHQAHTEMHRQRLAQSQAAQIQTQMLQQGQIPVQGPQDVQQQQLQAAQAGQQAGNDQVAAQQQQQGAAQQQGIQAAQADQQRQHAEEQHQQRMQHADEMHQARLQQIQNQNRGRPNGRS